MASGLEHRHLEDLVALLLAAGEALVDRALEEAPRPADQLGIFSRASFMKSMASSSGSPRCLRMALTAAFRK
jgi:hypothetical protein